MDIDLSITAILECSYSLAPFAHELEIHEGMLISDSTSFDEEAISIKGDEINVEEILYALISSSLPLKPVKPGAELPKSGEGYRVLTEDELSDSNHQKSDIRFAELDKFESDID